MLHIMHYAILPLLPSKWALEPTTVEKRGESLLRIYRPRYLYTY